MKNKYFSLKLVTKNLIFIDGINSVINMTNRMIGALNAVPGISLSMIENIGGNYQAQIDAIMSQTTRMEELFSAGASSSEETSAKIQEIWAGLKGEIFKLNEEQIASDNAVAENRTANENARLSGMDVLKGKINEVKDAEVQSYQTTLKTLPCPLSIFEQRHLVQEVG